MDQSTGDPTGIDPYANYRFKITWDGEEVAAVSQVGALTQSSQVVSPRELPSPAGFEPITLERGVTYHAGFQQWANEVWDPGSSSQLGQEVPLEDYRKDIVIEMYDEAGQKVTAYRVYGCWVSEFTSMPEIDGAVNAVLIQSITLQNDGWDSG